MVSATSQTTLVFGPASQPKLTVPHCRTSFGILISPERGWAIGDSREFYRAAIDAAEHIAGRLDYLVEPVRDNRGVLVGREFRFASSLAAVRFKLLVDTALAGRPLSSTGVTK